MFSSHAACTSVHAVHRGTKACWFPIKGFGDSSVTVPCRHFLAYMQMLQVSPIQPHFVDFVIFLSHHSRPFAHQPCPSLPHRAAGNSLPPVVPSLILGWFLPLQKKAKSQHGKRAEQNFFFWTGDCESETKRWSIFLMYVGDKFFDYYIQAHVHKRMSLGDKME